MSEINISSAPTPEAFYEEHRQLNESLSRSESRIRQAASISQRAVDNDPQWQSYREDMELTRIRIDANLRRSWEHAKEHREQYPNTPSDS